MTSESPAVVLAVTLGDPAGIGPECLVKALARPDLAPGAALVIAGDRRVIEAEAERRHARLDLAPFPPAGERPAAGVWLIDEPGGSQLDPSRLEPGRPDREGAAASLGYVRVAADLARRGIVDGIVTSPVGKRSIREIEPGFLGHTEFLGDLAGAPATLMLFCAGDFRVATVTTHLALSEVPRALTIERIREALLCLGDGLARDFRIEAPRIAVAALNPHAGEEGAFGDEEGRIVAPAIAEARARGVEARGPFPADSLFGRLREGAEFDAALALYHDQAMIPVKLAGFRRAVNVTLGLPFVRTSPAHGTALDIAGRGVADEGSLVEAIRLAARLAAARRAAR